ncbi:MAG: hypothetical protein MUC65_10220 [Pontiellaceae bacterium]|jgi:hypothetical protein|nr:hypothetical protein [Pontiellaceae bacterium]
MKKRLFFTSLFLVSILFYGCRTPPPPPPPPAEPAPAPEPIPEPPPPEPVKPSLLNEMQTLSAATIEAGGLAAIGIAESKSLDLALNMAKKNGRIDLSQALTVRIETLAKAFSEETGTPYDSLILSGFNAAAEIIIRHQISGSIAQVMKYEVSENGFTAYAFMELSPEIMVSQLSEETELYARLQPTQAFREFSRTLETYSAFKAAQKQTF